MKKLKFILPFLFIIFYTGCEKDDVSSGSSDLNDITLDVYYLKIYLTMGPWPVPEYEKKFLTSMKIHEEGEVILNFSDTLNMPLLLYAKRKGYYTNLYNFYNGDTINIDLDSTVEGKACGVLFNESFCTLPGYISNKELKVYSSTTRVMTITTDEFGRYAVNKRTDTLKLEYPEQNMNDFDLSKSYKDFTFNNSLYCVIVYKPNIYIYPETEMTLSIDLAFPMGGYVINSIPQYNRGWNNINVKPDGTINNEFNYLFYESVNPDLFQHENGWVIQRENLEAFFRNNMKITGFKKNEIEDFVEYWIPRLQDKPYYIIYPQYNEDIQKLIQLNFSVEPQNVLRLIYVLSGSESGNITINSPLIPEYSREGFNVAEWGVINQ